MYFIKFTGTNSGKDEDVYIVPHKVCAVKQITNSKNSAIKEPWSLIYLGGDNHPVMVKGMAEDVIKKLIRG